MDQKYKLKVREEKEGLEPLECTECGMLDITGAFVYFEDKKEPDFLCHFCSLKY